MKKTSLVLVTLLIVLLAMSTNLMAQTELQLPNIFSGGVHGAFLDVTTNSGQGAKAIEEFIWRPNGGGAVDFDVYYKVGTHVGYETNSAAWTFMGTYTCDTSYPVRHLDIPDFTIPANSTYGFHLYGEMLLANSGSPASNSDTSLTIYSASTTYGSTAFESVYTSYWTHGGVSYDSPASLPGSPTSPTPADLATDVSVTADLSWTNGADTDTVDLYFDTNNPPTTKVIDNTLATTYDPGTMDYSETYYWKVVCKNAGGDTEGDVWSFTTENPTAVTLSSFTATYSADELAVCWSTQSESNNMGWNIYRSVNECIEEAAQVNGQLIGGAGTTTEPTDYSFYDLLSIETETTYNYWLESRDYTGNTEIYGPVSLYIPAPGQENPDDPNNDVYGLFQNTPNPLDNSTTIKFNLKEAADCTLTIYNTKGQTVRSYSAYADNGKFVWDRKNSDGANVASGLYFYRLDAGADSFIKKMVVAK